MKDIVVCSILLVGAYFAVPIIESIIEFNRGGSV